MRKGHYKRIEKTGSRMFDEFLTITDRDLIEMGVEKAYELLKKVGVTASSARARALKALEKRPDLPIPLAYRDTPTKYKKDTGEIIAPELSYKTAKFVPKKSDSMNELRHIAKTLRNYLSSKTRTITMWEEQLRELNKALQKGLGEKYKGFNFKTENNIFNKNQINALWELYAKLTEAKKSDILFSGYDSYQLRQLSAYAVENYANQDVDTMLQKLKEHLQIDQEREIFDYEDEYEDMSTPFNLGAGNNLTR